MIEHWFRTLAAAQTWDHARLLTIVPEDVFASERFQSRARAQHGLMDSLLYAEAHRRARGGQVQEEVNLRHI